MSVCIKIDKPIVTPETLYLFMSVLTQQSEYEAIGLFEQAIKSMGDGKKFAQCEMKISYTLFRLIKPLDEEEAVWCAQYILTNVLGMNERSKRGKTNKIIAQLLMEGSQNAIERIYNKRNGTAQALAQVKTENQIIC